MIESITGSFPVACREFVIPADPGSESGAGAGIQRARLDSPYQVRGRLIKHGMTSQNRRWYPAACRGVVHFSGGVEPVWETEIRVTNKRNPT
jgi:hypothetical protein